LEENFIVFELRKDRKWASAASTLTEFFFSPPRAVELGKQGDEVIIRR
jgi:hypothetical protein